MFNNKSLNNKSEKGITLVMLTITVVVLLIIASITIKLSLKDNGVIKQSENTKSSVEDFQNETKNSMTSIYNDIIGK